MEPTYVRLPDELKEWLKAQPEPQAEIIRKAVEYYKDSKKQQEKTIERLLEFVLTREPTIEAKVEKDKIILVLKGVGGNGRESRRQKTKGTGGETMAEKCTVCGIEDNKMEICIFCDEYVCQECSVEAMDDENACMNCVDDKEDE